MTRKLTGPGKPAMELGALRAQLPNLAEDRDVRLHVATTAITPPEALGRLAADKNRDVRGDVAGNTRLLLEDLLQKAAFEPPESLTWRVSGEFGKPERSRVNHLFTNLYAAI